ncbi:MAG: hypothetical protein ACRDUA_24405, partial [Micromonosporaceae bacterium]
MSLISADTVITGLLRTPEGDYRRGAVAITGGTITDVVPGEPGRIDGRHVDAGDSYVLPGAVDAHVHSYSHTGEGLRASTSAAAAGGVTTIVEMPFDGTGPINDRDRLAAKQDILANEAVVDVALLGTLEPG